ncbi:DNA repair protein RAD50, ABC-type ATPase/SMC superfamily [Handroanthus impetiginosus]|uniref:DNA repair protein RAD50, ABC-type ATPase/SMC superfamily n=1 Tax=Handroanthus impetiginosus TaxID=429701 RepID=A0A2G9HMZ0_9LAMI|nr:DNA repair protein RAD50, ABC-type ATPase/SMC superfamily [Handroanthus impetiginosus]
MTHYTPNLRESIAQDGEKTETLNSQMEELDIKIQNMDREINQTESLLKDLQKLQGQIATKSGERKSKFEEVQKRYAALNEENEDTEEELNEWKSKFDERIALLESKISKLLREKADIQDKSRVLADVIANNMKEIAKLQAAAEAHLTLKSERDLNILSLFRKHNLGPLPSSPFSDEVALDLTDRIQSKLKDLNKDLLEKKRSNEVELKASFDQYMHANDRWKEIEAQKEAKAEMKAGILKRIQEKEIERDSFEVQISAINVAMIDERERNLQIEVERKANQLAAREFDLTVRQKQLEKFNLDQEIEALSKERDAMNADSHDRVVLSLKKAELESHKKKHRRMQVPVNLPKKRFVESKLQSLDQQSGGIDTYPKILEAAKEKRDVQRSKYNIADGMRQMFDPFERVARAHHICPCCERPFTANEEDEFVKKQRVKATSSAEHMKVLAVDSSNTDFHFQQLDKLRVELIPLAENNLNQLNEELDQKNQALDDVLGVLAQVKAEKDSVDALIQPVETADRLYQEIQALQRQVGELEGKLDVQLQGARSLEEIQSELKMLERNRSTLIDDLERLRVDQLNMEKDLSTLQLRWNSVREEKIKVANILSNVKRTEEEIDRLSEEKNQVELDLKHLAEAVGPLSKEKKKLLDDYNNLEVKLNHEYELQADHYRKIQQEVDALLNMFSTIKEYDNLNKGEKLKALQEKQTQSEVELRNCETRMGELLKELDKSRDLSRNQAELRRNIEENLEYRKLKAQVDELTREIESLEDSVLKMGGVSKTEALLLKLSQERESLLTELNRLRGTLSVYKTNIDRNKADLKQAQYKDIDKRYFDQLIQLKTTEMANKDLDRYYKALDKALMRFHTMKMEEINKIIRELWQQTYRGQDIDYISIHSDSEGAGTRSYSYRVLMQTGDAELEMRGRCSAGQKVLASLIIRLALAETFCLNCGILALDEPTTNLDGPNSESLAAALLRIMEDRKSQENFQLIVITHDERFAQLIGQRQHAEKYYRITKDDYQHSIIEAQEIFD